jgi:hypothetical protein
VPGERFTVYGGGRTNTGIVAKFGNYIGGLGPSKIAFTDNYLWTWAVGGNAGGDFVFNSGEDGETLGTTRMLIKGDGRVGIGTTTVNANAHVSSSGDTELRLTSGLSNQAIIRFGNSFDQTLGSIRFDSPTDSLQFYGLNDTERARLTSDGKLLVGTSTSTMSGSAVQQNGNLGIIASNATNVATNGTLDIVVNSAGGCYSGFLIVENTLGSDAGSRTQTTYAVLGRGTSATATSIATVNGSTSGASFTVTYPSNGTIRVTNTHGGATNINMAWFGPTGY